MKNKYIGKIINLDTKEKSFIFLSKKGFYAVKTDGDYEEVVIKE